MDIRKNLTLLSDICGEHPITDDALEAISKGKIYELRNYRSEVVQKIVFTHKSSDGTYKEGTTNEEVLDMLMDRLGHFQSSTYDRANQTAIFHLREAKNALKTRYRQKKRKYRNGNDDIVKDGEPDKGVL